MIYSLLFIVLGVILLSGGGEALIRGSLGAAKRLGVSPLLSGLVILGFGTSAPELVVSAGAALSGQPDIAIGNVVGSNITNILLILGVCALIAPFNIKPVVLRRDVFTVLLATILIIILISNAMLTRLDAVMLLTAFLAYLAWVYLGERKNTSPAGQLLHAESEEVTPVPDSPLWIVVFIITGLALLILGSQVLLSGAVRIALYLDVSEALIGLTLVALGTSLPELSVSVIAAFRGHSDVAVGNILGSNIFNILGILGISALLQPLSVHFRVLQFDQWILLGTSLLLLLFLYTSRQLNRIESAILLLGYIAYVITSVTYFG